MTQHWHKATQSDIAVKGLKALDPLQRRDGYTLTVPYRGPGQSILYDAWCGMAINTELAQTLGFALDTKIPRKRRGGVSKKEFKIETLKLILTMFKLEHIVNCFIGDAHIRGISGICPSHLTRL